MFVFMVAMLTTGPVYAQDASSDGEPPGVDQPADDEATVETPETSHVDEARLDQLFARLASAEGAEEADRIASRIWQVWFNPVTPGLATKMRTVGAAQALGSLHYAIDLLSTIIEDYPGYAEAWNQRATLYFRIGNFEASLDDVAEVLKREPRHFGALAGKAVILLRMGENALARQAMLEGLKYHPFLNEQNLFPELFDTPTQI